MSVKNFALASAIALALFATADAAFAHNPSMMGDPQNQMNMGMMDHCGQMGPMMGSMMGSNMMGPMMGSNMMGSMMGQAMSGTIGHLLTVDEAKTRLEQFVGGNKRLKVSKVAPSGDFSLAAEITTQEGVLVYSLLIDRRTGMAWETE